MSCAGALGHVAAGINVLDDSPEAEKQMLLAALPNVFRPNMHKFQTATAAMLRKRFGEARVGAVDEHVMKKQRVSEAQTVVETCKADVEASRAAEEAARGVLNENLAILEKTQAAIKEEAARCEEAEARKKFVVTQRSDLEAANDEMESVKNGSFQMLCEGGWEDEEVRDTCIDAVCTYWKSEGFDSVLLAALPKALRRRPHEAGAFDKVAVEEALRLLSAKVDGITTKLAEGKDEFDDLAAEHLGAWAILDVVREREQSANEVCVGAHEALGAAEAESKLAVSKVRDQEASLAAVLTEAELVESKVNMFDAALSAMGQLEHGVELCKETADDAMKLDGRCKASGTVAAVVLGA